MTPEGAKKIGRLKTLKAIEKHTDKNGPIQPHMDSPCWLWTGRINEFGYGRLGRRLAHQGVYAFYVGSPPKRGEADIDHICKIRRCVNPSHLRVIPIIENRGDANRAKTHCPSGHPYDDLNTIRYYHKQDGGWARHCGACIAARYKPSRQRPHRINRPSTPEEKQAKESVNVEFQRTAGKPQPSVSPYFAKVCRW